MAISQAMCTSFKVELLSGGHNFNTANVARSANTQDSFKMALYTCLLYTSPSPRD